MVPIVALASVKRPGVFSFSYSTRQDQTHGQHKSCP